MCPSLSDLSITLVKMLLVRLLKYLGLKKMCQVSFAEYHSKRNPVECIHATEEKALSKHAPSESPRHEPHTPEQKEEMVAIAEEVRIVFSQAKFAGQPTTWGINESFESKYVEDYQMLINDTSSSNRTAWQDKYTMAIFNESSLFQSCPAAKFQITPDGI